MAILGDSTLDSLSVTGETTSQGRLDMPNIPLVSVSKDDGGTGYSAVGPIPFNVIWEDTGSIQVSNSNSRFTVTESGFYYAIYYNIGVSGAITSRVLINKNGSTAGNVQARGDTTGVYPNMTAFKIFKMEVGDYLEAKLDAGEQYFSTTNYVTFLIHKVL